jgi:hypothetical protein
VQHSIITFQDYEARKDLAQSNLLGYNNIVRKKGARSLGIVDDQI